MNWQLIATLVGSVVGATGLFKFIEFLITRKDSYHTETSKLSKEVQSLKEDIQGIRDHISRNEAINCRIRILRAADEMKHSPALHSEEYFDQLNDDITKYQNYCNSHPDFKNNKAMHSIEFLNKIYQRALSENNFL